MKLPLIIVNFKTYTTGVGKEAVKVAKLCQAVAKEHKMSLAVAVGALDVPAVAKAVDIPVFAQHVDGVDFGSHTGSIHPEVLKEYGASGSLINHSEDPYSMLEIESAVKACKKAGLTSVVCAPDSKASAEIAKLGPDFVAVEPPELIGSERSVSTARPELVSDTCKMVAKVNPNVVVLCGAGVVTSSDVSGALSLGAHGVLLASGVLKAKDPKAALVELVQGLY